MRMSFFKNGKQVELQGVKSPDPTQGATTHVMLAHKDNQEELQIILKDFACLFHELAGRLNTVANALSRRDNDEAILFAISMPQLSLFYDIRNEGKNSPDVQQLISAVHDGTTSDQWSVKNELLLYKHQTFLASNSPSIQTVMTALHNQGHEGTKNHFFGL
ncbi:hypothetical protein R3W88_029666 [Solanum pinnatisectum]|uniref:Uncharacterized protein n=1 Tax=Solanum pinnatisectum TaxID=50273 RepID=A0AAV9K6F1_9SOLN|nr:hypothetical protein R3W88_029666 [Solanum pinnatisectum]